MVTVVNVVFWDVTPWNLVHKYQHLEDPSASFMGDNKGSRIHRNVSTLADYRKGNGVGIPLQAETGAWGSRWLRVPTFLDSRHVRW